MFLQGIADHVFTQIPLLYCLWIAMNSLENNGVVSHFVLQGLEFRIFFLFDWLPSKTDNLHSLPCYLIDSWGGKATCIIQGLSWSSRSKFSPLNLANHYWETVFPAVAPSQQRAHIIFAVCAAMFGKISGHQICSECLPLTKLQLVFFH